MGLFYHLRWPQQLGAQRDVVLSEGVPKTRKAVRAYRVLTSWRNCSSFWGTVFIGVGFLSIAYHGKSTALLSLAFAQRDGTRRKRTRLNAPRADRRRFHKKSVHSNHSAVDNLGYGPGDPVQNDSRPAVLA